MWNVLKPKISKWMREIACPILFVVLVWQLSDIMNERRIQYYAPIAEKKTKILQQAVENVVVMDSGETADIQLKVWSRDGGVFLYKIFYTTRKREDVLKYYSDQLEKLGWVLWEHREGRHSDKSKSYDGYEFRKGNLKIGISWDEIDKDWDKWGYGLDVGFVEDPKID